jgi:hypothetical protein
MKKISCLALGAIALGATLAFAQTIPISMSTSGAGCV